MSLVHGLERAKELFKEHMKDGWNPEPAWNDCCCSYMLNGKDAQKLRNYMNRYLTKLYG